MTKCVYLTTLLVYVVLPVALLLSIAVRPFGLSIIYLLLYLIAPLTPVPNARTAKGCSTKFLCLTMSISILLLLVHGIWHITLVVFPPYGSLLQTYPLIQEIGHNLGLVSYHNIDTLVAIHYLTPELVMTITSLIVYIAVRKLLAVPLSEDAKAKERKTQQFPLLTSAGKYICLIFIMFSGIMRPSITSGLYFLVFMGAATAWSVGRPLQRGFAVVGRCLMAVMATHVAMLLVYQCTWLVDLYPPDMDLARYFGLMKLVNINETDPTTFTYEVTDNHKWATLASPIVIMFTYLLLACETRELFKPKLIRNVSPSRWSSIRSRSKSKKLRLDSMGSVVVPRDEESTMEEEKPSLSDDIIAAVVDFFEVLVRSSYIATTITMMAWSIMFHSWLGFVFLMWANIVWLCQDQRSFMLKTSPLLVIYAMFLLLAQYIYGMDLYESELPSHIENVNLQQIGLGRPDSEPCVPLLIKSLFACMFWVTLRQRVQEVRARRRSAAITDMAAPLQLTVSTAASVIKDQNEEETRSRLLRILGDFLRAMCARYWIYVVAIMLFVIGITGTRMTIFRIVYMFLFLGFILMFQISFYWWRRLMYAFWITVIIYSMINLILVYVYQFDDTSRIIAQYLGISERLQHDLGLEPYRKADLFVKLLTPTCFLIITIMQVHYFHKDFMELSDTRSRQNSMRVTTPTSESRRESQAIVLTISDEVHAPTMPPDGRRESPDHTESIQLSRSLRKPSRSRSYATTEAPSTAFRSWLVDKYTAIKSNVNEWIDSIFLYLHLHLMKIIFVALAVLCVTEVCALHVPIMLLLAPGLLFNTRNQRIIVLLISILISIYFMLKLIYQIDFFQHSNFGVNCTIDDGNSTVEQLNNAGWVGFSKSDTHKSLASMLKGYIGLIAIFTFNSLVIYRQRSKRDIGQPSTVADKVMFPHVTRKEADTDLWHCTKYIINYGFYKFGVEVTLICLIGVIGSRMDAYAVLYALWLMLLASVKRATIARVWPAFTVYVTILVSVQYLIAVGFVPQFCIEYPWSGDEAFLKHLRTFFFLPYAKERPHASKLLFDFVLLLFASRQLRVFGIERTQGDEYAGGSNSEDIGKDWETPQFVNPVPDFLDVISSWLVLLKRTVFLGMLWVTLAIMFLTGTNRVNLFSMGYLIGSFIFLWQGTDFYLRPKKSILQWWSWLLSYNVTVVVVKTVLQIPGCLYGPEMRGHACWVVQLLGIGCVDKFAGGNIARFIKMSNVEKDGACAVPQEDIGLAWDGVCFAFLILQRRLFHSYYFYRVIDESKATTVLASRGAELIEELRQKQMQLQETQEVKILEKIKVKMERIKANQKKIHGNMSKELGHHDHVPERPYRQPTSHQKAVRSGDYYMFDEFDDTEVALDRHDSSSDEDAPKEMGLGKLLKTAIKTDLKRAVSMRRASMPAVRTRPNLSIGTYPYSEQHELDKHSHSPHAQDVNLQTDRDGVSDLDDIPPIPAEKLIDKLLGYLLTARAFVSSLLVTITKQLMRFSRDYRYVSRALSMEKKILKEKEGFGIGRREGSQMIWEPLPETLQRPKDLTILEEQEDSMFKQDRSPIVHLLFALWYIIIAHTDIVCYIMVFINQIQSATILSIPLPMMVFLWGTLTIPRPTKTFWVTLIAYTEVIVLLKSMFQFEILPWNQIAIPDNMPFTAPRIIGIERKSNYALYDLLLLLIIFLHRFMLKSLGLWKESNPDVDVREDAEYPVTAEDTALIVEGREQEVGRKYVKLNDAVGPSAETLRDSEEPEEARDGGADAEPEPGPSRAPDDDHYNVNDDQEPIIAVRTTLEDKYGNFPKVLALSMKRYLRPTKRFFERMLAPGARVTADVYAYMFLCDFLNFLVVIFGFAAFGTQQGDGGVQAYLEENKVPIPFLVMLILQFALIIIDRALYLRKYMLGKILFQYALVIGVHVWMFFVLPFVTERTFNARLPPPFWYMMKSVYLLLSAHQIRCGYPRRIIGNFLCKSYRFLNMVLFRCFMAVPFVFELRTLMDWIWTDTSMTLMDWLKMEDIFANVFLLKCSRYIEDEYPQPRGLKKSTTTKYLMGGAVLAFVIAIIWFPLVFFAFGNSVGQPNPPTDVTVKIRIGPFLPVYQMSAQSHNIDVFTEQDFTQLSNHYSRDRTAQTFLSNYMYNDVAVVNINPNSTLKWEISPPELERLKREALSNDSLSVTFSFVITHPSNNAQNPPTITESRAVQLPAFVKGERNEERIVLQHLLSGNLSDTWLNVHKLFPKFIKVLNKGTAKPAYQLTPETPSGDEEERLYRNVQLRLEREGDVMYWRVRESCTEHDTLLLAIPKNNCDMLVMYTFNDKLFPETLNFISGGGIIGLYTTFVFLASRVLRGFFSGIYTKIMFDDLPNVDRVLQLCLDIYLVREAQEMALEEDLFAKLVFLYRSPETMIKWTRPKDDDADEQRALPPLQ